MQPCVPFTGPGTITGTGGKLSFKVIPARSGCGDEAGQLFSVVRQGEGHERDRQAHEGEGDPQDHRRLRPRSGTFTVKFKGTLTQ